MAEQQLTYEGVLEMFRETNRDIQKTSREIRKVRRLMKERDTEFDRRMQKTELQMERTSKEVGNLGHSIGRLVEHMLGERIIEKFQALGYGVTHPVRRNHSFENTKLGISGEFDLTLVDSDVNGDSVMI